MKNSLFVLLLTLSIFVTSCAAPVTSTPEAPVATAIPAETTAPGEVPTDIPAPLVKINVCYTAATASQTTIWYAFEKGLFKKYGLDVTLIQIAGGSKAITALISGDVSICQMTGNSVINAVAAGQDAVMIAGLYNTYPGVLMAQPEIKTTDDLKGKIIGVSATGSAAGSATLMALRYMGLKAGEDVTVLEIGEEPARVAAMDAHQIDATFSTPPYLHTLQEKGYTSLFDFGKLGIPYAHTGIGTTRKFIAENQQVAENFMKAVIEAIHMMKSDPDGTKSVLAQYAQVDPVANAEDLTDAYNNTILPYLQELPYPNAEALQNLINITVQTNPDAAKVTTEQIIDSSIVKELEDSGFITNLGK